MQDTPDTSSNFSDRTPVRVIIGRRLAVVAAFFMLLVALLMSANWYLLRTVDPLDAPALALLAERLERQPDDQELQQQLRELDLLARRVFFTRQWQLETGWWLLAGTGIILMLALQMSDAGRKSLPDLRQCPGSNNPWPAAVRARRVITIAAGLLLAAAAGMGLRALRGPGIPPDVPPELTYPDAPVARPAEPAPVTAEALRNWPAFRGATGLGLAPYADPPVDWDGAIGSNMLWKTRLPRPGYNSPVVWDRRVFLTGADRERREVYCFDADTGALLWSADTAGVDGPADDLPAVTDDTGYAAPSVASDGRRVAAIFGTGAVLGLDFDGRRLWTRRLPPPDNHYGHSSSLLIHHDLVFVQYDHFGGAALIALDAETGATVWETARDADISWASPVLVRAGGRKLIVLSAAPMVAAYDALTGEELWSNACLSGEIGSSPAHADGRIFVANQYAQAVALDAATGAEIWSSGRLEMPDAASPVATDRHLFLPTAYGAFSCVDARDGSLIWEHDFPRGGYGSPILAAGRIYWTTEDGRTHIFKAADTFELIAAPGLGEACFATPAAVGRRLYIRGANHLFCFEAPHD